MSRRITGYVCFDESRKSFRARFSYTDFTGKRKTVTRYGRTKTEARNRMQAEIDRMRLVGREIFSNERQITFRELVERFSADRLIPAIYQEGKIVAGMRNTKAPKSYLKNLNEVFGGRLLNEIKPRDLIQYKLQRLATKTRAGKDRRIASVNRELEQMRTVFNYAVANDFIDARDNPFTKLKREKLIDKRVERRRERLLSFAEEMALLDQCTGPRAHLRPILIVAMDTGLRRNELLTLEWAKDISFERRRITLRPENAKTNVGRVIPMTPRVYALLSMLRDRQQGIDPATGSHNAVYVFGGVKETKRSYETAKRLAGLADLRFHDLRHAYVTRTILSGVPPAVVVKASGHASEEWKRYLNVDPQSMGELFRPLSEAQTKEGVRAYGLDVMDGLAASLGFHSQGANLIQYAEREAVELAA